MHSEHRFAKLLVVSYPPASVVVSKKYFNLQGVSIQKTAMAARKSYSKEALSDVDEMAAMGNWGRNPSHIAEQMTTKYCEASHLGLPEPYLVETPVVLKSNEDSAVSVATRQIGVFLPHDWFAWMGSDSLEEAVKHSITGLPDLQPFWSCHDMKDPKFCKNPVTEKNRRKFWPLILHGDGGAFQRNDSINVLSVRCLLSKANVAASQMLLMAVPKACMNKSSKPEEDTMECLWRVLVWSFRALFYGKHPARDHMGKEWPQGSRRARLAGTALHPSKYRAFIFALAGDGEFFQNEYKLPGASFNDCCFNCKANKSSYPFNDFRPTAKWRSTVVAHQGTCPTEHPVSQIPGVVGETFAYDTLHILEEGVAAHALGNVFFDFVVKPGWPGSQDARLKQLLDKILRQYNELGVDSTNRIGRLHMSNFCNPKNKFTKSPVLSGLKARQIRYLVPCMLAICQEEESDIYSQHRTQCLLHLEKMYEIIDSAVLHLSVGMKQQFRTATNRCLQHYTMCCKLCMGQNLLQWNVVHKHHLAAHIPDQADFINPKFLSTYSGETMVGFMSSLAHACLNGTPPHLVPIKVAWRFRLSMWLRLCGCDFDGAEE